jgi:hypothetical protein
METQQPLFTIRYPVVPVKEENPRARVNKMIEIFNEIHPPNPRKPVEPKMQGEAKKPGEGKVPPMKINAGMLFEIAVADRLVKLGKIHEGRQISRGLSKAEIDAGLKGNSQMIMCVDYQGAMRELDIVYNVNEKLHIMECKNKSGTDASQMQKNILLAIALNGTVEYALPLRGDQENPSNSNYYNDAYRRSYIAAYKEYHALLNNANPPALQADQISHLVIEAIPVSEFSKDIEEGWWVGLAPIMTTEEEEEPGRDSW